MNRVIKNYIVFIALILPAIVQAISGFILWRVLPGGEGYRGGLGTKTTEVFLWDRHVWIDIHDIAAAVLLIVVIIHIILHWKWITTVTKRMFT
jgi:hypothetical protein